MSNKQSEDPSTAGVNGKVEAFFERYAAALLARDAKTLASMYAVPSLIVFPWQSARGQRFSAGRTVLHFLVEQYDGVDLIEKNVSVMAEAPSNVWADVAWSYKRSATRTVLLSARGGGRRLSDRRPYPDVNNVKRGRRRAGRRDLLSGADRAHEHQDGVAEECVAPTSAGHRARRDVAEQARVQSRRGDGRDGHTQPSRARSVEHDGEREEVQPDDGADPDRNEPCFTSRAQDGSAGTGRSEFETDHDRVALRCGRVVQSPSGTS